MAQPATPFTTDSAITVGRGERLILRCGTGASILVLIKVGKPATVSDADYFLTSGDAVEITPGVDTVVNVVISTGTPSVYWRVEPIPTSVL